MARLKHFINEKINKREIDEILGSSDVLIGAEFEFNINMNNLIQDYEVIPSNIQYKEDMKKFLFDMQKWEEELADQYEMNMGRPQDEIDYEINDWIDNNPEPVKPTVAVEMWVGDIDHEILSSDYKQEWLENYLRQSMDTKGWEIEDDPSLGDRGIELKSPPMDLQKFLKVCPEIFDIIDKIGDTDDKCGLHINISFKGVRGGETRNIDPVKLCLFTDEGYIWKYFDSRKSNMYCVSMQNKIKRDLMVGHSFSTPREKKITELKDLIKQDKIKTLELDPDHYHGVNIEHLYSSYNPYIEFRYTGGAGYHKMWDKIRVITAHYIYNLKLAKDPDFKKKEYILKATRILNKFETWAVMRSIWDLEVKIDDAYTDYVKKALQLELKELNKKLQFLPKLSGTEISWMRSIGL